MIKNRLRFLLSVLCLSLITGYLVGSMAKVLLFVVAAAACILFVMKVKRDK